MSPIGHVESVWRYPVKSMRGQAMPEVFVGFAGVYGNRLFAFKSATAPPGFPFLTGRERHEMLLYRPRHGDVAQRHVEQRERLAGFYGPCRGQPRDVRGTGDRERRGPGLCRPPEVGGRRI